MIIQSNLHRYKNNFNQKIISPHQIQTSSIYKYIFRLLILDRERQTSNARASPPPTYRSNAGTLLRLVSDMNLQIDYPLQNII